MTARPDNAQPPLIVTDRARVFERRQSGAAARRLMERDEWQDEFAAAFGGLLPPSAVIIEGEPGFGKTALLNAACHLAAEAGHEVLRARGVALEADAPFGVVRQVLQPIPGTLTQSEHKLWPQMASAPVNGSRHAIPFEAIHDLYLSVAHLASRQPVLVAIDDLHCADIESLWWVQHLLRRLEPGRLSFVGSSLSRVAGAALGPVDNIIAEPSTRLISLRPLTARSVAELIRHHLGREPEASFVATCCRITGGNPFLVHSMLTTLRQQGNDGEPSEEALAALSPPPVARAILRRLSDLSTEAQAFIRAAAVLGDESDQRVVAELAGVDGGMGNDLANSLAEAHLLQRGRQLSFVHPLERSTVYVEIDPVSRTRAHAEAARLLHQHDAPLEQVARHLLSAEPVHDEWSPQSLERVARLYTQRGQFKLAEKCLSRSLDESSDVSARPRRLLALASLHASIGRPGALALLREAADLGADPVALADATYRCLKAFAQELYPADTVATLRHLEEHLGKDNSELRIWIEIVLATWGPSNAGQSETTLIESALAKRRLARSRQDRMALAHLSHVYSLAPKQHNADYVADLAEQALRPGEFQPEDGTSVVVTGRALIALARTGRFDVVDRLGQAMQDAALSRHHATSVAEFSTVLADFSLLQGNLDRAEVESRRALAATEGILWASRPLAIGVLAATLMEEGRTMEAASALNSLPPVPAARTYVELLPLEQRARLKALDGRASEALEDLLLVKEYAGELGITNPAATSWRSAASSLLAQLGRVSEARDLAAENLELSRAFGAPQCLGDALRTAAEVGQAAERIPLLEEAADVLTPSGASLECAKATIDLGAAYADKGRQDEAIRSLRRGADLAFHCRAQPLVERAARELRAAGARPRRLALVGAEALTPAERRVAALAADGLLNAEIAEALFVSEKTVEGHLTRVYQKLGTQRRAQLRETLKSAFDTASKSRPLKGQPYRRAV